jgi:hypothetical protein
MIFFLSTQYQDQVAMFKSRCQTTTGRCVWMVSTQLTIVVSYGTRIHELKTSFLSTHHPFIHSSIHPSCMVCWVGGGWLWPLHSHASWTSLSPVCKAFLESPSCFNLLLDVQSTNLPIYDGFLGFSLLPTPLLGFWPNVKNKILLLLFCARLVWTQLSQTLAYLLVILVKHTKESTLRDFASKSSLLTCLGTKLLTPACLTSSILLVVLVVSPLLCSLPCTSCGLVLIPAFSLYTSFCSYFEPCLYADNDYNTSLHYTKCVE